MERLLPLFGEELKYHCFDDEAVVFNPVSGETHHVGLFVIELLSNLHPLAGVTKADLYSCLADVFVDFSPSESLQMIEDTLSQLESFGLVKRAFA